MRGFVIFQFVVSAITVIAYLTYLARSRYPRIRSVQSAGDDVASVVIGLAMLAWTGWLLLS